MFRFTEMLLRHRQDKLDKVYIEIIEKCLEYHNQCKLWCHDVNEMFEDTIRVIRRAVNERRTDNTMTKRKKTQKIIIHDVMQNTRRLRVWKHVKIFTFNCWSRVRLSDNRLQGIRQRWCALRLRTKFDIYVLIWFDYVWIPELFCPLFVHFI
jgi:hypothetical protein